MQLSKHCRSPWKVLARFWTQSQDAVLEPQIRKHLPVGTYPPASYYPGTDALRCLLTHLRDKGRSDPCLALLLGSLSVLLLVWPVSPIAGLQWPVPDKKPQWEWLCPALPAILSDKSIWVMSQEFVSLPAHLWAWCPGRQGDVGTSTSSWLCSSP